MKKMFSILIVFLLISIVSIESVGINVSNNVFKIKNIKEVLQLYL